MPGSRRISFGSDAFLLDGDLADAVEALRHHDPSAALALARRHRPLADGQAVTVSMMMMDAAPSPSLSANHARSPAMPTMSKIQIGDREHFVDADVARELEGLRGQNAALSAMIRGEVRPVAPVAVPVADAAQGALFSARDALRAQQARNDDPSTPQGAYREYLRNAHRQGR